MTHSTEEHDVENDAVIGRAFGWSLGMIAVVAGLIAAGAYWATRPPEMMHSQEMPVVPAATRDSLAVELPHIPFTDVTEAVGIHFMHNSGARGEKLLPETMGSGCAIFDYDNDGDQDLLLINARDWPWTPAAEQTESTMALYRNDGMGHFEDVTAAVGLDQSLYGMGAAVGDFDNDGWRDLYVTAVGANRLFRNEQGRFVDVTETSGTAGDEDRWSTSSGWLDYDNDGDLDLFVCNYVQWSREIDLAQDFRLTGVGRAYGPPFSFAGTYPYLFRNDGDGRFSEFSQKANLRVVNPDTGQPMAKSLGLAPIDFDRDGWIDVVMANDTVQNFVFHNRRDGTFEEVGATTGIAFDTAGKARGAMGIDAARFRNDDTLGVAVGNFSNEMTAFYVSLNDPLLFSDAAIATGLGPPTRLDLTFGLFFFDADLDGRLDLLSANGHLEMDINKVQASQHFEQPPKLFYNAGPGSSSEFVQADEKVVGQDFARPLVGRGAAYADIDGDGDLDVLLTTCGGSPRLLRNDQALPHHWLRIQLEGTKSARDAIGAWIEAKVGSSRRWAQVMPTRSYLSQVELPVTIGLGEHEQVDELIVHWPDGSRQRVVNPTIDELLVIQQDVPNQ